MRNNGAERCKSTGVQVLGVHHKETQLVLLLRAYGKVLCIIYIIDDHLICN